MEYEGLVGMLMWSQVWTCVVLCRKGKAYWWGSNKCNSYLNSHDSHAMLGKKYNSSEANRFITAAKFYTITIVFHLIIVII